MGLEGALKNLEQSMLREERKRDSKTPTGSRKNMSLGNDLDDLSSPPTFDKRTGL